MQRAQSLMESVVTSRIRRQLDHLDKAQCAPLGEPKALVEANRLFIVTRNHQLQGTGVATSSLTKRRPIPRLRCVGAVHMEMRLARVGSFWSRNDPAMPHAVSASIAKNPAPV